MVARVPAREDSALGCLLGAREWLGSLVMWECPEKSVCLGALEYPEGWGCSLEDLRGEAAQADSWWGHWGPLLEAELRLTLER